MNDDVLVFSDEPLPPSAAAVTLAILSEEDDLEGVESFRGLELPQRTALEGRVTFDPRGRIFFIPNLESTVAEPLLVPDREKWDLYLVNFPFTLHVAPENAYYEELTFFAELKTPGAIAHDLFPDSITAEVEEIKTYTLSPQIKFNEIEASLGQVGRQLQFKGLRPTITAFGKGESKFYWLHQGFKEQKAVIPGTKQALVVLQVPRGMPFVEGVIAYRTIIAKKAMTGLRKKEGVVDDYSFRWELRDALPLFHVDPLQSKKLKSSGHISHFDVCFFCALAEEAERAMREIERECNIVFQSAYSASTGTYYYTTVQNKAGEPLTLRISWQPKYGPVETGLHIKPVLEEFRPNFAAMTGICAGDRGKVKLGDLVVAESAFAYDAGKVVIGQDGRSRLLHEVDTWHPSSDVLHFARIFQQWRSAVAGIPRPPAKDRPAVHSQLPELYIGPVASGNTVRSDNPFEDIRSLTRNTIAVDMEAATFYRTVAEFPGMRSLLVKGVSDYADGAKDDTYHDYASAVSAAYMLSFIKEYFTSDRE